MEAARHDSVVRHKRDGYRLGLVQRVVLDGGREIQVRRLHAGDLAPVDAQEDTLLRVARREGGLSGRDLDPGGVARHSEGEVCGAAHVDVDIPVSDDVVGVDGECWVRATVTRRAVILVISCPEVVSL